MTEKTIAAFVALMIVVQLFSPFYIENTPMYGGEVVRLHVIANSDSDADQKLKLKVRDAVLEASDEIITAQNASDAADSIFKNISSIEKNARKAVAENGFSYDISVVPGVFSFPARTYSNITLPKGNYRAARVIIGEGKGKNWWCVMFPPLCFTDKTTAYMPDADVLKGDDIEIRLKLLELISK